MANRREIIELEKGLRQTIKSLKSEWEKNIDVGVTRSQSAILEKLDSEGPQKVSALAEALCITTGGITGLADKLEELGYSQRKRLTEDRRVVQLEITEAGREIVSSIRAKKKKLFETLLSGLSDEDIQHLTHIYKKILKNLGHTGEE